MTAQENLHPEEFDASYRMQHQGADPDFGEALHELGTTGRVYPDDVLSHPDWYGAEHDATYDKIYKARGRPDRTVSIYRSLPAPHRGINTGDWVAISPEYARQHGRMDNPADDWPVVKGVARADQLINSGDSLEEWAYHGPPMQRAQLHFRGGANQAGRSGRGKTDSHTWEHEPPEMQQHYSAIRQKRREEFLKGQGQPGE
jgi:hypothetical protein